ncbi:hypothetical protein [Paenibacillus rigui]|uniref:Uncharacterized protein n=1 Tax=Paenibacillus rigui TaxID=554312 RepID=A0A229ULT6_9BACL|nr:hypothetical protein [Paenibacillus rigui]OXM84380.1 hypothetical protein CF651_21625 [Paenibacillus rigui]
MALSKAKKHRLKSEREGRINPELQRLGWNGLVPIERKTPTRAEQLQKLERKHKHKWNRTLHNGSDGSICVCWAYQVLLA